MRQRYLPSLLCFVVVAAVATMGAFEVEASNQSIARNTDGSVDCAYYVNFAGAEPAVVAEQCGPEPQGAIAYAGTRFPGDPAYSLSIGGYGTPDEFISFPLPDMLSATVIGSQAAAPYAMDFDPTGTVLWAIDDATAMLGTIDTATAAFTPVVACPAPVTNWTGLTIDAGGTFWGSDATSLYTIDPTTGVSTLVGPFNTTGALVIDIAVNAAGEMYAHDIGDDNIYSVDTATGAATLIGPTGQAGNFAQGMDFDFSDGTLYAWIYTGGGTGGFCTIDLTTGAATVQSWRTGEWEGAIAVAAGNFEPLRCNGPAVTFDGGGIPEDWTVNTNTGDVYWSTTDDLVACDNGGNQTLGSGEAACADSDQLNASGNPYDTELWSTYFSLSGTSVATLQFAAAYNDIGTGDTFEVWVWDGTTWTMEMQWDADFNEIVTVDLTAYAGLPQVGVSFRYSGDGWDWWAQVDDISLSCLQPAITLSKVVDTTVDCPAGADSITVAPGTDVYYCYTVENTGNVSLSTHDLVDDQLGTLLTAAPYSLEPGMTFTYNHAAPVTINAPTVNVGTWTAYVTGTPITASAQDDAEVLVLAPDPLFCGGNPVTFDAGLPPDWTVVDNMGTGVVWLTTGAAGYPIDCGEGNYTSGGGLAACISSDEFGGANYDSELIPPVIDFTGFGAANLFFGSNYNDISAGGNDRFDVDISLDGGTTWANVISWDEDHGVLNTPPGEDVMLDLTPFGIGGQTNVAIRFHNYSTDLTDPWDWYAEVDDAFLECIVPVDIQHFSVE